MLFTPEHYAKVAIVEEKLQTLDPLLVEFFTRHGYEFRKQAAIWPRRRAWKRDELDRQFVLVMDWTPEELAERGFSPEMPWSLRVFATRFPSIQESLLGLEFDVIQGVPFWELAQALPPNLEKGLSMLGELRLPYVIEHGRNFWAK